MGRFGINDFDNYGNNGVSSFFSLPNDGDTANIRFMYNGMEDVEGYAVHEVEVDGKRKFVNCLRSYNEPKSVCPFCAAGNMQRAKMYIPVYDTESGEVKIWERGKLFSQKLSSICARYASGDTPLVAHTFDIERHGKKGDAGTTYEVYETGCDKTRLEDLPEIPNIIGTIVLDKTADEMNEYLDTGSFPEINRPTGRRGGGDDGAVSRRTPSRNRGDAF